MDKFVLSEDQAAALGACMEALATNKQAVLAGAAGTGKSTVMREVLDMWKGNVLFMAPTGKAALRLAETTGRDARTIHSSIFGRVEEKEDDKESKESLSFGDLHPPEGCSSTTLVVVDEASMVDVDLAGKLRQAVESVRGNILWVGDHEQLSPVGGKWGVNLASPTAKLTTVHRQALESDVLALATLLREGKVREFTKWGGDVTFSEIAYAKQAAAWKSQNPDRMLLTWTNKVRGNINLAYRRDLGFKKDLIHDGETLICTMNNHGKAIVNGELFTVDLVIDHEPLSKLMGRRVQKVFPKGRTDYFLMIPSVFDMRKKGKNGWWLSDKGLIDDASEDFVKGFWEPDSGLDLKEYKSLKQEWLENRVIGTWGYCLTVHKSQGSQWEDVAFVSCWAFRQEKEKTGRGPSADDRKRMLYTAVTRASERVHIFKLS